MGHVPALVHDWENGEKEHGGREKEREEIKKRKVKMYFNKGVGRGGGKEETELEDRRKKGKRNGWERNRRGKEEGRERKVNINYGKGNGVDQGAVKQ